MVDLWRWRFDFLLRRRSLLSRQLGGSGVYDPGVRGRSMMDLWRRRFGFFLRRPRSLSRWWAGAVCRPRG
jgi:hypothetical protein